MTDEQRIRQVMEQCGLTGFEETTREGRPCFAARTPMGRAVTVEHFRGNSDGGRFDFWDYRNDKSDSDDTLAILFDTLDDALAALEQDFSVAIIASLRAENAALRRAK